MSASSHAPRPGSWTPSDRLSTVGSAVERCVADLTLRGTAELVGASKSTIGNWGSDLANWPGEQLLLLALRSDDVGAAIVSLLQGDTDQPQPEPTAAIPEACQTVHLATELIAELIAAVQVGRFRPTDARCVEITIDQLLPILSKLRLDVRAAAR